MYEESWYNAFMPRASKPADKPKHHRRRESLLKQPEHKQQVPLHGYVGDIDCSVCRRARLTSPGDFFVSLVLEVVAGAVLGFLVWLVFAAVQAAGSAIDLFGGFQLAMGYDPGSQVNGAQFTRLFQMTALVLMFTSGGYQLIIGGLTRTFDAIPVGVGLDLAHPVQLLVSTTTQMFLSTLQIAGPLIVVLFLADAGLGLLTRVAPALNAFQLGYPLKIMITLGLAGMVFVAFPQIVNALSKQAVDAMMGAVS